MPTDYCSWNDSDAVIWGIGEKKNTRESDILPPDIALHKNRLSTQRKFLFDIFSPFPLGEAPPEYSEVVKETVDMGDVPPPATYEQPEIQGVPGKCFCTFL